MFLSQSKTNWKFLVIVIISAIIVAVGVFWLMKLAFPQIISIPAVYLTDWQTYRNEEYGFEIKYPADWEITNNTIGTKEEREKGIKLGGPGDNLTISEKSLAEEPTLKLFVNPNAFGMYGADISYKLTLDENNKIIINRTMIPACNDWPDDPLCSNTDTDGAMIIQGYGEFKNIYYIFWFTYKEGGKNYETILQQILSTFRLTK